jgi:hypothetical protein
MMVKRRTKPPKPWDFGLPYRCFVMNCKRQAERLWTPMMDVCFRHAPRRRVLPNPRRQPPAAVKALASIRLTMLLTDPHSVRYDILFPQLRP